MLIIDKNSFSLKGHRRRLQGRSTATDLNSSYGIKSLGQPSPSVVESLAIIADSLLSTS